MLQNYSGINKRNLNTYLTYKKIMRLIIILFETLIVIILCFKLYNIYGYDKQIENLNKQIELLECYKENYLIMADSIQNIHNTCFRIGQK